MTERSTALIFDRWVRVTYQTTPESEVRTIVGKLLVPTANDGDALAILKLSDTARLPLYSGMIISCGLDEDRAWMERHFTPGVPSNSHAPWWV